MVQKRVELNTRAQNGAGRGTRDPRDHGQVLTYQTHTRPKNVTAKAVGKSGKQKGRVAIRRPALENFVISHLGRNRN
jgi:hypothetical protein